MSPPAQMLGAGRTEQGAIVEDYRFVLDRPEDPARQPPGRRPSAPAICRGGQHAPPAPRARPDLVEQQQRPACRLMQHRVPAGLRPTAPVRAPRHLDRRGPLRIRLTREPDADAGVSFARSPEPSGHHPLGSLRDGRSMGRGERRFFEDELGKQVPAVSSQSRPDCPGWAHGTLRRIGAEPVVCSGVGDSRR
jgi:hypothetical protein